MKRTLLLGSALLASLSMVHAQGPGKGGKGGRGGEGGDKPSPADMVKHLAERFAVVAAYDTDSNGKLDSTEQKALAKDIDDGKVEMGPPGGPPGGGPPGGGAGGSPGGGAGGPGGKPSGSMIAERAAKLYESLAAYDKDKNKSLDDTEQAAVADDIKDGKLKLPQRGGPGGPGGPGGGRGGRPGGPPPGQ